MKPTSHFVKLFPFTYLQTLTTRNLPDLLFGNLGVVFLMSTSSSKNTLSVMSKVGSRSMNSLVCGTRSNENSFSQIVEMSNVSKESMSTSVLFMYTKGISVLSSASYERCQKNCLTSICFAIFFLHKTIPSHKT